MHWRSVQGYRGNAVAPWRVGDSTRNLTGQTAPRVLTFMERMDFGKMPGSRRSQKKSGGFGGFGMRGRGQGSPWRIERGSLGLLLASAAVFAACAFVPGLLEWLVVKPAETLRHGQIWRLATPPFTNPTLRSLSFSAIRFWCI